MGNYSRVMATCRSDGKILKPDRPLTPPDACFRDGTPTCQIYTTYSDVMGIFRVYYYFNNDGDSPMTSEQIGSGIVNLADGHAVYNWYTGEVALLSEVNRLAAGYEGHIYASVTQVIQGWIFLGEVDKYVTVSSTRFASVHVQQESLSTVVLGVDGEVVKVCAASVATLQRVCKDATFTRDGYQTVTFSSTENVLV